MATRKGSKKARTTRSGGGGRKRFILPQEPIIIGGGGSVELVAKGIKLTFPKSFKAKASTKHDFKNPDVDLEQLVVLAGDGTELYRRKLNPADTVVLCFTGSLCIPVPE